MTHQWRQAPPTCPPAKRSTTATTVTILLASIVGLSLRPSSPSATSPTPRAWPRPQRRHPQPSERRGTRRDRIDAYLPGTQAQRLHPQGERTPTPEVRAGRRQHRLPVVAGWGPTYDPDKTYALIYEVHGGEDGPVRNHLAITGDHHHVIENDQFISTSRVDQRLIVKAVAVEELAGAMFTPRSCQPQ